MVLRSNVAKAKKVDTLPSCRDSGNDFFVPKILDGSGTFPFLLGVPEPVTSLMGGCYMKWIWQAQNTMHHAMHPFTRPMHSPACPSSQTQIPAQRNQYPSGLYHTAAMAFPTKKGVTPHRQLMPT